MKNAHNSTVRKQKTHFKMARFEHILLDVYIWQISTQEESQHYQSLQKFKLKLQ